MPCINAQDRSFTLGHGLFETMFVNQGDIPAFSYHWERLNASAPKIDIKLPFSQNQLKTFINEVVEENDLAHQAIGVRVTVSHGEAPRGIWPSAIPAANFVISAFPLEQRVDNPFKAFIVAIPKNEKALSASIKSTSYLDNILAKREAINNGFDEAILLNGAGFVADGAISNIFMVKCGEIVTPSIEDGALPGIIRSILIQELGHKYPILERSITKAELLEADEVFVTNALLGVQPVRQINDRLFSSLNLAQKIGDDLRTQKNYI